MAVGLPEQNTTWFAEHHQLRELLHTVHCLHHSLTRFEHEAIGFHFIMFREAPDNSEMESVFS
jgi:hypothetical protein